MEVVVIEERAYKELIHRIERLTEIASNVLNSDNTEITEWLNGNEVCELLNISKRTLQTLRTKEIIPYSQIYNKIYYNRNDVENLIKNLRK